MIDDLLNDISKVVKDDYEERKKQKNNSPGGIAAGDIVNNQGTVVIGGNVNQGRREEDKEAAGDGSHGRRASDRKVYKEIRQLRRQIKSLRCSIERLQKKQEQCLVTPENTDPESGFKQPLKARSQTTSKCRKPSVQSADFCPIYVASLFSDTGSTDCSETRAIIDSVPFNLIHSRIIPFVPHHLTAHI